VTHFYDADRAGAVIGISGHAFRKRAERAGIHGQVWPFNRVKFTLEQVIRIQDLGKPEQSGFAKVARLKP
jgi:S1-C subfamily serine protease